MSLRGRMVRGAVAQDERCSSFLGAVGICVLRVYIYTERTEPRLSDVAAAASAAQNAASSGAHGTDKSVFKIRDGFLLWTTIHHRVQRSMQRLNLTMYEKKKMQTYERSSSSPRHLGVPYDHVRVRVLGDASFLGVEVEDFRRVAAGDGHKSILVHFAAVLMGKKRNAQMN